MQQNNIKIWVLSDDCDWLPSMDGGAAGAGNLYLGLFTATVYA